uniref:Tox-SGS domain-containing protein n=1 Tax=Anopheles atroparvus TaxID=41427 RepID=A0AAG5CVE6_ANOAO
MGRPVQLVEYVSPQTARLREILYDEIDRPTMQTKWTKLTYKLKEYFAFNENFVSQVDGASHRMAGIVATVHRSCEGYPYSHTVYAKDPTENKEYQGLPGKEYTVTGKYKRRYAMRPEILLLSNLFPEKEGFRQKIVERPGRALRATVEDNRGNKVAKFWQVGNYDHRLTTYEYSKTYGYLSRELPPQYHALVKTTSRTRPFLTGGSTEEENRLKGLWEVSYHEDKGRLVKKRTPDGGSYEYVYNDQGILRYTIHYATVIGKDLDRVIHFTYAANGKVTREALVNLTAEQCYNSLHEVPPSENLIETTYGELDTNPLVRYRSQQSTRRIGHNHMIESLIYDENEKLLKKVFVVPTINTTYSIDYEYENDNVRSVRYPVDSPSSSFKLIYDYNGHGEVATIRESTQRDPMFEYTYNADGMVETMKVRTGTRSFFKRIYTYNEPGFLVRLADDYLTEDVSYLETDSYGQDSYTPIYEGLISRTVFTAHWQRLASSLRTGLYPENFISSTMNRKQAAICFDILKQKGYLNEVNQPTRTFYGERDDDLPFICGEAIAMNHLSAAVSSGSFPHQYGHRYDYDDHDQLIKAKYFHGPDELLLAPLTHRTFAKEIDGVQEHESKKIWDVLLTEGFLSADCTNPNLCHGRPGTKSMFHEYIRKHRYYKHLQTMLSKAIAERKGMSGDEFDARCKQWNVGSNLAKSTCRDIKNSLTKRNFIGNRPENPLTSLSDAFRDTLKTFKSKIPDIVRVLSDYFAKALGRSAGDVQSYEIDANGNHRKFYTGFSRYRLEYRDGTNQITKLHRQYFDRNQREEEHFNMEHNSDGAVVKAEHKGIKRMEYDRILHRVTEIEMQDGRKLLFQYDVRAERTFKQVRNPDGTVSHEKYYIRDAHGMVLVDMEMTYLAKDQPPDVRVTSYIYKDQQLVGFVRNDKLYGVITDHEGSVRLVVRDGEVVAAYDYLPYGQIFRRYGTDLDGQISYLYTGQEWEPETGLYNYRARLYDPDIGRFYQMDPKEQYPSPYVYAGNSPVSLVDPDGEFAFALAVFIMAIVGAYLGAASANNCWNPLKWDWRSSSTWLGLLTGAVTGASIPFNMASSVAFFVGLGLSMSTSIAIMVGAGITFAYFTIAASSGTWDPTKFDFTSPGTWNALMNGVATSSWILMNPSSLISSFTTLTSIAAKALFIVAKVTMSLGFTYLFAAMSQGGEFDVTKWDFSDPALYMSFIDGFTTATVGLLFVRNIPKQMSKWTGKVKRTVDLFVGNSISYRAHMVLGRDWSSKIMHTQNYLYVNFRNMQTLTKGFLTVGFYSVVCSLRVSQMFDSPIPEFRAVEGTINMLFTTEQFSDFIVKPLSPATPKMMLPKPPNVARLLRFRMRSEAISLGNESVIKSAKLSFPSAQASKSEGSSFSLRNCYQLRNEQYPDGIIACYGHSTMVSIHPKIASMPKLEQSDRYKHCAPLTYGGHPSVSCDGEWSSLLYTAKESSRVFDLVDGWLMLAQIAPCAFREIKRAITYLVSGTTTPKTTCLNGETLSFEKKILQGKLEQLRTKIEAHDELDWARWTMEDLTNDVHDYFTRGTSSFGLLTDKAKALEEDILEAIYIHSSQPLTSSNQFLRQMTASF